MTDEQMQRLYEIKAARAAEQGVANYWVPTVVEEVENYEEPVVPELVLELIVEPHYSSFIWFLTGLNIGAIVFQIIHATA